MNIKKEPEISIFNSSIISKKSSLNSVNKKISKRKTLKSTLLNLMKKYSNDSVMESLFYFINYERKKIKKKSNSELDEIMCKIYQKFGPVQIFQTMLSFDDKCKVNEIKCIYEESFKNNDIKFASMSSTSDNEPFIELNNNENIQNSDLTKENSDENNNNKNSNNDVVIEISHNYKDKTDETDETDKIDKTINLKEDSEDEKEEEYNPDSDSLNEYPYENKKRLINKKSKFRREDISYHCSMIGDNYYKYKKSRQNIGDKDCIEFKCFNPNCDSVGTYNIKDKTFRLDKPHYDGTSINCYKKLMTKQDWNNLEYMRKNNIYEIQMYNEKSSNKKYS